MNLTKYLTLIAILLPTLGYASTNLNSRSHASIEDAIAAQTAVETYSDLRRIFFRNQKTVDIKSVRNLLAGEFICERFTDKDAKEGKTLRDRGVIFSIHTKTKIEGDNTILMHRRSGTENHYMNTFTGESYRRYKLSADGKYLSRIHEKDDYRSTTYAKIVNDLSFVYEYSVARASYEKSNPETDSVFSNRFIAQHYTYCTKVKDNRTRAERVIENKYRDIYRELLTLWPLRSH